MSLHNVEIQCPTCGEIIEIEVEPMSDPQSYIQDCSVCCRPILLDIAMQDDELDVQASRTE